MHQQWYPQMNTSSSQVPPWQPTATPYGSNLGIPHKNFPSPGIGTTSSRAGSGNNLHLDPEAGKPKNSFPGTWPVSVNLPQEMNPADTNMLGQLQAQMMGNQLDPYFIGDGTSNFYEFIYPFCDWTFLLMLLFAVGSAVGLGIVLGEQQTDNIFASLDVTSTAELDVKIAAMIKREENVTEPSQSTTLLATTTSATCTTHLFGSFGSVCLEDGLNSQFFLLLLSHLNVGRGALWCLAVFFSFVALALVLVVHAQRHPRTNAFDTPFFQAEFLQMSPAQQALFIQQNFQPPGCCGSAGVDVYDTPFYAFFRFAWGFTGIVALIWGVMLLIPSFTIIPYFIDHTTDELKLFWQNYQKKFIGSILAVIIYLAWPIVCHVLEAVVWVVGIIPWAVIRTCLKPGIERFRPEMKLSELPGYIRADMFFMDFQDLKRFGFSRLQWNLLTDTYTPFFECWEDPLLIRDPDMMNTMVKGSRALLLSQAAAAASAASASASTPAESPYPTVIPSGLRGESNAKAGSQMQEAGVDGHEDRPKHRHRSDHRNAGEEAQAETGERSTPSPGHHRHGRSGGHEGLSRSHRHRSGRSEGNSGSGENGQTGEREVTGEGSRQRRRHRGNRENSGGEGSGHRHRHSNSGRRSHGSGGGNEDGSRRRSGESAEVSRSLSKPIEQLEELMKI